ncbi:granulocyte colony-stimulating factor [Varanus komodoensis]|uniref:Colony stimulating factor 3 n=1 Tax=Varanus komodoensis TaxID=61221 RepID=A0A8D2LCP4_VARKO|nr:granulocyte colony-stimulating factor [Varanus komodoensis]
MNSALSGILSLISVALWSRLCSAVPLAEFSGDPGFQEFIRKNREFVYKIKSDVTALKNLVHKDFKLGSDDELSMVQGILGINQVDHSHCPKNPCDTEGCFNQIQTGLHTYHAYLSYIAQILPSYAGQVAALQLENTNLSSNIQLQMEESGMSTVTYPQAENQLSFPETQRVMGSYLVLRNLQKFMEMTFRALRHCSA